MISFSRPKVSSTAISGAEIERWMRANPDKVTRLPGTKITPRPAHKVKPAKAMGYDVMPVRLTTKSPSRYKPRVVAQPAIKRVSPSQRRTARSSAELHQALMAYLTKAKEPITAKQIGKDLRIANVASIVNTLNKAGANIGCTQRIIDHRLNNLYYLEDVA